MNNEQQQINKAVKKGVNKITAFAVEFKPKNGGHLSVEITSFNGVRVWLWSEDISLITDYHVYFPRSTKTIDNFNCKVETLIAEIERDYK
ncbi:MAG: hypothetical protein WBG43_13150 [Marinifilaceae bacterium]